MKKYVVTLTGFGQQAVRIVEAESPEEALAKVKRWYGITERVKLQGAG